MLGETQQRRYLERIEVALMEAKALACQYDSGTFRIRDNGGRDVVTEVDRQLSHLLRKQLLAPGEGWLSEEDADNDDRLTRETVWVVDPLDGTREFVDGIPEWCISIGLVESGVAVAGGTLNPATEQIFLGAVDCGVTLNGCPVQTTSCSALGGALVLASRSEYKRGEWKQFDSSPFVVQPLGSVAYKLSLVAAGLADATWTLSPKHEWDVAAGVALVNSAGGRVERPDGSTLEFNRRQNPLLPGLIASGKHLWPEIAQLLCRI